MKPKLFHTENARMPSGLHRNALVWACGRVVVAGCQGGHGKANLLPGAGCARAVRESKLTAGRWLCPRCTGKRTYCRALAVPALCPRCARSAQQRPPRPRHHSGHQNVRCIRLRGPPGPSGCPTHTLAVGDPRLSGGAALGLRPSPEGPLWDQVCQRENTEAAVLLTTDQPSLVSLASHAPPVFKWVQRTTDPGFPRNPSLASLPLLSTVCSIFSARSRPSDGCSN